MDGFTAPLDCKIGVFVRTVKNGLGNLLEALDLATINGDHPVAWTHAGLFGRSAGNKFVHYRRSDVLTVHHCEARQDHNSEQAIDRSEEHTSELQSLMRISYAVFCLKKKKIGKKNTSNSVTHTQHDCHPLLEKKIPTPNYKQSTNNS